MELDPDDSRAPYLQVAGLLRAAILTGRYAPGDRLPSGLKSLAPMSVGPIRTRRVPARHARLRDF